jgi:hypothetical protein
MPFRVRFGSNLAKSANIVNKIEFLQISNKADFESDK